MGTISPYLLSCRILHSAATQALIWRSRQGLPADLNSQRFLRTSAVNQTSGNSLKESGVESEMSSLRIFSAVRPVENLSSPVFNHSKVSRELSHEVRAWSKLSISPELQTVQRELFTSWRTLLCRSRVGRSWWRTFHKKLIDELDNPLSLENDQLCDQLCCGSCSSTRHGFSVKTPSGDNSCNS